MHTTVSTSECFAFGFSFRFSGHTWVSKWATTNRFPPFLSQVFASFYNTKVLKLLFCAFNLNATQISNIYKATVFSLNWDTLCIGTSEGSIINPIIWNCKYYRSCFNWSYCSNVRAVTLWREIKENSFNVVCQEWKLSIRSSIAEFTRTLWRSSTNLKTSSCLRSVKP